MGFQGTVCFNTTLRALGELIRGYLNPCVIESSESSGILVAPARSQNTARVSLVGVT